MKIRNGFVSNSSSASFIVAVKTQPKCSHCGRSDLNFLDLVENMDRSGDGYETTKLRERGVESIEKRWTSDIEPYSSEEDKKEHASLVGLMIEADHKGYEVGEIEISYHDTATENLMHEMKDRGVVKILWSDHYGIDLTKINL